MFVINALRESCCCIFSSVFFQQKNSTKSKQRKKKNIYMKIRVFFLILSEYVAMTPMCISPWPLWFPFCSLCILLVSFLPVTAIQFLTIWMLKVKFEWQRNRAIKRNFEILKCWKVVPCFSFFKFLPRKLFHVNLQISSSSLEIFFVQAIKDFYELNAVKT